IWTGPKSWRSPRRQRPSVAAAVYGFSSSTPGQASRRWWSSACDSTAPARGPAPWVWPANAWRSGRWSCHERSGPATKENAVDMILRAAAIYAFVWLVLRISGKRTMSEMTAFDFVLLLIFGEATQQAILGDDLSLTN